MPRCLVRHAPLVVLSPFRTHPIGLSCLNWTVRITAWQPCLIHFKSSVHWHEYWVKNEERKKKDHSAEWVGGQSYSATWRSWDFPNHPENPWRVNPSSLHHKSKFMVVGRSGQPIRKESENLSSCWTRNAFLCSLILGETSERDIKVNWRSRESQFRSSVRRLSNPLISGLDKCSHYCVTFIYYSCLLVTKMCGAPCYPFSLLRCL